MKATQSKGCERSMRGFASPYAYPPSSVGLHPATSTVPTISPVVIVSEPGLFPDRRHATRFVLAAAFHNASASGDHSRRVLRHRSSFR